MPEEQDRYEYTYLHSSGPIPGFPGAGYGAGPIVLDKLERKVYTLEEWEAMQAAILEEKPAEQDLSEDDRVSE